MIRKHWMTSLDNGFTGGTFKRFRRRSQALAWALANEASADWVYLDDEISGERYYVKTPSTHIDLMGKTVS